MWISVIALLRKKSYKHLYFKCHLFTKPVFMDYIFLVYFDRTNALGEGTAFALTSPDSPSLAGSFHLNPTISFFPIVCIENYLHQNCWVRKSQVIVGFFVCWRNECQLIFLFLVLFFFCIWFLVIGPTCVPLWKLGRERGIKNREKDL